MNPIFDKFGNQSDPVSRMFGTYQNFQQQFANFANSFSKTNGGISPQQKVQQMLQSGQMTQQQFEQLSQMANSIMGRK